MNRKVYFIIALMLIIAMLAMPVSAAKKVKDVEPRPGDSYTDSVVPAFHKVADLMAGQNTKVGEVYITPCVNNEFEVRYEVQAAGWYLTEVHFEAISEDDIPYIMNNGTLIPGQFTVKEKFDLASDITSYSFRYSAEGDIDDFAAHAVVGRHEETHEEIYTQTIFSDIETQYVSGSALFPSVPTWVHDAWDNPAENAALMAEGAIWIWESYYAENPRTGDNVEFVREFTVVGTPQIASLAITTDNEFSFAVNSIPGVSKAGAADWAIMDTHDLLTSVTTGLNSLNIFAENWPWGTDSSTVNPGGLLYKLYIESMEVIIDVPEIYESCWGAGVDAGTKNWAMLISYTPVELETAIFVPADGNLEGFGDLIGDKLILEFSGDIVEDPTWLVDFATALYIKSGWPKQDFVVDGNLLTFTVISEYSSPRDISGDFVVEVTGFMDVYGRALIIPSSGVLVDE